MWPFNRKKEFKSKITPPWECNCRDIYCRGYSYTDEELETWIEAVAREKKEWEFANENTRKPTYN